MPPSNLPAVILVVVFLIGALLAVIGTMLQRERRAPAHIEPQSAEIAPSAELELETRLDHVERLAMVAADWCVTQLEQIRDHDPEHVVRDAAENALLVIRAR